MMTGYCAFREEHDPVTLEPLGPACGKPATQIIYWRDGRASPACDEHGMSALDDDARALVSRVARAVE